jgi:hypothetical protein
MSLTNDQKDQLNKLYDYRDEIENLIFKIETTLESVFPSEYSISYQHWLPQIKTALRDDIKWLPRGQYSMEYTLNRINDKIVDDSNKGVTKYI